MINQLVIGKMAPLPLTSLVEEYGTLVPRPAPSRWISPPPASFLGILNILNIQRQVS